MRTLILAVLFGLFIPSVATAAPSNPCKFRVISGRIAFTKACTATEKRLLPHAVKSVKARYTLKSDLKSAAESAQGFYTRYCKKVVSRRKATSRNWAKCYKRLPSSMMMQQMMLPSISLQTYVWEMCGKVRNLNKLAKCADKAATDEKGQINSTVWEAVEAYRTLKRQKATARKYIKAVTGCKLGSFSKLKCAGLNPLAFLLFIISLLTSRRSDRKEWWDFEALGYLEARNSAWAIEDYLWKTRWVERLIEAFITLTAFSLGGLILGAASAFLAHKRFGWASIFSLFLSVLFWGSTLEWGLFVLKAAPCFLSGTDQGLQLLKHIAQKRWKGQVSKL